MRPGALDLDSAGADAWDLDLVTAAMRDAAPRLAYLVPDHQNPTGALLDGAGRERLVALARRTGTPLLIDETLAELTLVGSSEVPVAAHGAPDSALVITIGSAAKVLWGGLRIGWIRTAAPTIRRLAALRAATDLGGPVLEQLIATRLIDDLEPVVQARRAELTGARDHLLGRLGEAFPSWRPSHPTGGLSLWVDLGAPVSSRLVGAARRQDVLLAAGPRFGLAGAFDATCACRTPCAATAWSPRSIASSRPGTPSTSRIPTPSPSPSLKTRESARLPARVGTFVRPRVRDRRPGRNGEI